MTDIDPMSDIELHTANEHLIVRVPLTGLVTGEWLRRYERLAHASGVPVQVQADIGRAWIVVNVPASGNHREVAATMDAARALIAEADAAARAPATPQVEGIVRDWWARRRESATRKPISKIQIAFPEQLNPVVAPPGWRPQFFDYLYLGFTNATAFSPTDVMPLARWAKAAMTIQATGSLAILGLVIARAVNILQ
jgi:hypothetical protein